MSGASGDDPVLHELERNIRAELTLVEITVPAGDGVALYSEERLVAEVEAERYEIGLRGLLGAVEALEDDGDNATGATA
ncbi:hypothetical protein GCM10023322_65120 [Rugosimonospora acidiphila]|uniref:Uncharacterized protein n=1 Tax=Rugosimonospora acidiphila TaxID=556531 RepID=A0ABP9SKP5_9ACTN